MASKNIESDKNRDRRKKTPNPMINRDWRVICGWVMLVITLFAVLSIIKNAGTVGDVFHRSLVWMFGHEVFFFPIILGTFGIFMIRRGLREEIGWYEVVGAMGLFLSVGALSSIIEPDGGGALGTLISTPLFHLFNIFSIVILVACLVASFAIFYRTDGNLHGLSNRLQGFMTRLRTRHLRNIPVTEMEDVHQNIPETQQSSNRHDQPEDIDEPSPREKKNQKNIPEPEETLTTRALPRMQKDYVFPPLSLLMESSGKPSVGDVKENTNIIKRTLQNFGIDVEMDEVSIGPTVTRYALKPAEGVRLGRISALQSELSLALAAHPIRVEAPIPGKSLVGIEIPNRIKTMVGLGTVLAEDQFQKSDKPLLVALGKGVTGKSYFENIAEMPHALIAGTTGSGKSVTIHNLMVSLLYRNSPEDLRFILVDPKRVELTLYNKIPHLLTPVIKEPKKAILALKWATKEMERRYNLLEERYVRDIGSYHATIVGPAYKKLSKNPSEEDLKALPERLPYIVIIIDELADIMTAYPRELEAGIVRLAQMSRAVGIHLVLSTQRPSVNVITGLIKANVPTRAALQVASQIDSRTILDTSGAEKLLGHGDMLFMTGKMSKPERMQCPFVTEDEIKKVVAFIREHHEGEMGLDEIMLPDSIDEGNGIAGGSIDDDNEDDLYEQARQIVIESRKASTSYMQRKLGVGYARAARLIDMLEERGVIGPGNGAKPRDVIEQSLESERHAYDDINA